MKKSVVAQYPKLPEALIKAHAEAIKRFYEDKAFAVKSFLAYDKAAQQSDMERVYDLYAKPSAFERVPYVLAGAVKSIVGQQADAVGREAEGLGAPVQHDEVVTRPVHLDEGDFHGPVYRCGPRRPEER